VSRSHTPHSSPALLRLQQTGENAVPPSSPDLPAVDDFATGNRTDLLTVVPPGLRAGGEQPLRLFSVRVLSGPQTGLSRALDKDEILIGRGQGCDLVLGDSALSRRHCRIVRGPDGLSIEDLGSCNGTFVDGEQVHGRRRLIDGNRLQLGRHTMLGVALQDPLELRAARQLYENSMRDPLTGIHNRRYLDQRLQEEFSYALRHKSPVSVLIIDLDYFKRINDQWGHATGDLVLRQAAEIIQSCVRREDVAARFGGEEFAMVARIPQPDGALTLGERVRRRIERCSVAVEGGRMVTFTASVGIASTFPDRSYPTVEALLESADHALYRAKGAGRNRCADDRPPR